MTWRMVEAYSREAMVVAGMTVATWCLVEDDDAIRMLVGESNKIPKAVWARALEAGARAIIRCGGGFDSSISFLRVEDFIEFRTEITSTQAFRCTMGWRGVSDQPLNYVTMMLAPRIEVAGARRFGHLHTHSEHSLLDGVSHLDEIIEEVIRDEQEFVAITDHATCAAHPGLQKKADVAGLKPIFGVELNLVDDRFFRPPPKPTWPKDDPTPEEERQIAIAEYERLVAIGKDYNHLVVWALNDEGLRNIWAMSTESHREGFYYRARLDWDTLQRYSEGVACSTACLRGPLSRALVQGREEEALQKLGKLLTIFPDRLYVELHCNHLEEQIAVNHQLVDLAGSMGLPLIATVDSHYPCADDQALHRIWIASQTHKDLQEDADLFAGNEQYHVMSESEVVKALGYLPAKVVDEAISNCSLVAERCNARVEGKSEPPVFSRKGGARADVERLTDLALANWDRRIAGKRESEEVYEDRFAYEMSLLVDKGFTGYFLMVSEYCMWAKENRILVGPSRGSGGGCLVAYLAGIIEIDPVEADLMFERFLTPGRTELPDFDIDFPTSKRGVLTSHVVERWGEENVVRVGTHVRSKCKGIVRDMARTLKGTVPIIYADVERVCKAMEVVEKKMAGQDLDWDEFWDNLADESVKACRERNPDLFAACDRLHGRIKSFGKHAAGVVISTDASPLIQRLPMRMAGDEKDRQLVADFEMNALSALGLVKFDLLTLRTLDTIQMAIDLIAETRGVEINIYDWGPEEYGDPKVWDEICAGRTLGMFQIETRDGTSLCRRYQPRSLADLADIGTLVRPGPQRSGLTDTFFRRRNGEEEVTYPDPRLKEALSKTYGVILYQEDIMKTCMVLAGYDGEEADRVRSILGKKKVEKIAEEGARFIPACIERGMKREDVERLWSQMAEFAKYSFNRAHAYAYALLGFWEAWLKTNYPAEFLTACLSTVDNDRIPDFVQEARRMGYLVLPPDINESGRDFTPHETTIRYGFDGLKGLAEVNVNKILAGQPYTSFEDFRARAGVNIDKVLLLAKVGAFDALEPNRHQLEFDLEREISGEDGRCVHKDDTVIKDHGLPCTFDWDSEPVEFTLRGRQKARKPIAKRCTKACRHYTPPVKGGLVVEPYTPVDIRESEMSMLGVYLSSTPFERIDPEDLAELHTAEEIEFGPLGDYLPAAIISGVRETLDRNGKKMAFVSMYAQNGKIDVTVFQRLYATARRDLRKGALVIALVEKTERGLTLKKLMPV